MKETFNCTLFDGENLFQNALVSIEDGKILSIEKETKICGNNYFMMPPLIDAHTHLTNIEQVNKMLKYGIGSAFDVSASQSLIDSSKDFNIISSIDMAMGFVFNPKKFVERAINRGAKYIKVLLFNSLSIGSKALKEIVLEAHKRNLKVVVHATEIATYKQAIDCDVDIILHLPIKDDLNEKLVKSIADKGIYIVPTLVMMETFAKSGRNGYKEEHFLNALKQVETLYKHGVQILVGTDSNIGNFAPKVTYGDSLYNEINLLLKAGIPISDVLKGVTSSICKAYDVNFDKLEVGKHANVLLFNVENNNLTISYENLKKIWINGKEIK